VSSVSEILTSIARGEPHAADRLLPLVYDELRKLAQARLAAEKPGQTLQATALVHEAYLRLAGGDAAQPWNSRGHFFAAAAEAMRRILIDRARHKRSDRAGGGRERVELNPSDCALPGPEIDLLALDEALDALQARDPRAAELVKLRYFAGLTMAEAAETLGVSAATADNDWAYAKSFLKVRLASVDDDRP
jgi:RNA polymerase sigma factor (TIGR02999 family)